jgi:hypothetical protein
MLNLKKRIIETIEEILAQWLIDWLSDFIISFLGIDLSSTGPLLCVLGLG